MLWGCAKSEAATDPIVVPEFQVEITPPVFERPPGTTFQDVLDEYQALNARLARVAAPLRTANAELCPRTIRDPGFTTHRLADYPPPLRPVAEEMLGMSADGLHIRAVRPETSAQEQRLEPGDRILSINEAKISSDPSMKTYNRAVIRNGFDSVLSKVRVRTAQGREFVARIQPVTACDIPAKVIHSPEINGHTDGQDVLITSALMRSVPDDTNLALIVAHEMAHVIAGHRVQSQAIELEADRMALVLLARAGYDVEAAVNYWAEAIHPHGGGKPAESTHPATRARYENFRTELARIRKARRAEALGFN